HSSEWRGRGLSIPYTPPLRPSEVRPLASLLRGAARRCAPLFRPYISLYTYAPTAPAAAYFTSSTTVPTVYIFCGNNPIGASPSACSRLTKNHTATPAITAVWAPAPKRGRIAAYTHKRPMP